MNPTITCFELPTDSQAIFQETLQELSPSFHFCPDMISSEAVKDHPETTHLTVFVYSQVTKEILDLLPNLQAIFTMSTGFDHIDLAECQRRNITVHNVPSYGENTVAEHAMALILTLSRRIRESLDRTAKLEFTPDGLTGFDLCSKTLGIVGMGKIGSHVARMARGFEMNVLAYDAFPREGLDAELGFKYVSLEELLSTSDIITLHAPYLPSTHHMINKETIKIFKKGSYLINTSRGALVETEAIIEALNSGILAGAGLDVLEEECALKDQSQILDPGFRETCDLSTVIQAHMLIKDPRVIVTPHNAFNSVEANRRILDTTIANIRAQIAGELKNVVK